MTSTLSVRANNKLRMLALAGAVGPALFTALVVYLGSLTPGYSQITQEISDLGATGAPNAVMQDLNFLLLGGLIFAFSVGLLLFAIVWPDRPIDAVPNVASLAVAGE